MKLRQKYSALKTASKSSIFKYITHLKLISCQYSSKSLNNKGDDFPKKIGIIFLEKLTEIEKDPKKDLRILDFDQEACAYLILQMNKIQNIFDFQVITLFAEDKFSLPEKNNPYYSLVNVYTYKMDGRNISTLTTTTHEKNYVINWKLK